MAPEPTWKCGQVHSGAGPQMSCLWDCVPPAPDQVGQAQSCILLSHL